MRTSALIARGIIIILVSVSAPSTAGGYVADGHEWDLQCNDNGFRLRSKSVVTRFIEAGVNSRAEKGRETMYLGRSCDALHSVLGGGTWCWANGGFKADFSGTTIGFPRQELICERALSFSLDCDC